MEHEGKQAFIATAFLSRRKTDSPYSPIEILVVKNDEQDSYGLPEVVIEFGKHTEKELKYALEKKYGLKIYVGRSIKTVDYIDPETNTQIFKTAYFCGFLNSDDRTKKYPNMTWITRDKFKTLVNDKPENELIRKGFWILSVEED